MTEVVGEAIVELRGDTDRLNQDVDRAGKEGGKTFSKGFGGAVKGLAGVVGGVLAAAGVANFLGGAIDEAREGQKVAAATNAIIKATGGVANVTAGAVADLAGRLSAKAGVDDELIQTGANLILTFKNVRNEAGKNNAVFDRATQAALDLSAAGFGSVESASLQLGKALNDPIKGIAALGRSGVTFTQAQKDQIKALTESGRTLEAQKIILAEVEGQVGGVAAATATAGDKAAVAWGNVKESVGTLLLPALDAAAGAFTNTIAPAIQDVIAGTGPLGEAFHSTFGGLADTLSGLDLGGILGSVLAAAMPLLQGLGRVFQDTILPGISEIGGMLRGTLLPAFQQLLPAIAPVAEFLARMFGSAVVGLIKGVITAVSGIITVITGMVNLVKAVFTGDWAAAWDALKQIVSGAIQAVWGLIQAWWNGSILALFRRGALFLTKGIWQSMWNGIKSLASKGLNAAKGAISGGWQAIVSFFKGALTNYVTLWRVGFQRILSFLVGIWGRLRSGFTGLASAVRGIITGMVNGVKSLIQNGFNFVLNVIRGIPGKIAALGGRFLTAGKNLIGKFVDGLKNAGGVVQGIAGNVWDAVKGLLNGAISKINSALEFKISLPGPDININPPNIPLLATGTRDWRGGAAVVGERGPELVGLPEGASVFPHWQTRSLLDGAGGGIDYDRLAAVLVAALIASGANRPINVQVPTDDPEALTMRFLDSLAAAAR